MAASRGLKAYVELDGEKEYKQALEELNRGNRVLASEMRKLQEEYKGNENSVEALTKKGDLLQRQLLQQKDKIALIKNALANAVEKYGEASKTAQDWMVTLNNAETAEIKLQRAIDENNETINEQGSLWAQLGEPLENIANKFGIKIPDSAKKALTGVQGFSAGAIKAMSAAAAGIAAATKAVTELHKMTVQAAAEVDELITTSMTTGLTTQTLQEMEYASNLIDVSVDTISGSLRKLTTNMKNANDGNSAMAQSFASLGVSITDSVTGALRPAEEVFYEVIDALGQVQNETERDAIAMELFGESAQNLNPMIIQGADSLRSYAEEAQNVGYILSEDEVAALGAVDDAYQRVGLTVDALKNQIAADFAPASKSAMELFSTVVQKAAEMLERSGIIENLAMIISSLMDIFKTVVTLIGQIPGFTTALDGLKIAFGAVAYVIATVADGLKVISGLMPWNWGSGMLKEGLGYGYSTGNANNQQRVIMAMNGDLAEYDAFYAGQNATGNDNWRGGLTWVGEAGPELVNLPRGSSIANAQDSRNMGGVIIENVTIDAHNVKDFNDVVNLFSGYRVVQRMGAR